MRVLYVSHFGGLGGAERSLLELMSVVRPLGVEPTIACPAEGELGVRAARLGIPHLQIPATPRRRPRNPISGLMALPVLARTGRDLVGHIRSTGAEIVHSNSTVSQLYCGPSSSLCRVPNVWHWRDFYDARRLARCLAVFADRIVAISRATYQFAHHQLGSDSKLALVPNGIGDLSAAEAGEDPARWRQFAGTAAADVLIVMAGQSVPRKGHEVLIRAMAQPAVREANLKALLFCAELDEPARSHTSRLRELVKETGVADRVAIATGCSDLAPALRAADILAVPSLREPFGRIAVEGMLARLPVVAADVDGLSEIVEADRTGLLAPPADPAALAEKLVFLADRPYLRAQMGCRGRERAVDHFSTGALAERMVGLYRDLVRPRVQGGR